MNDIGLIASRSKKDDPSNPASASTRLHNHLTEFKNSLSRNLQYSSRNTDIHMYSKASLPSYALMHIMYFTSVMLLHRSSLYFVPLQSKDTSNSIEGDYQSPYSRQQTAGAPLPSGELPPKLSDSATDRENLDTYLRAAQQLLELVRGCHDRDVMCESPLVGWGIYQSCFAGIYAVRFGLLNPKRNPVSGSTKYSNLAKDVCKAIEILAEMRPRLKMAGTWFRTLHRLNSYYGCIQQELPLSYKPLGDDKDVSAVNKVFARYGCVEDQLQMSVAPQLETMPNPYVTPYTVLETGSALQAPQLSKSTPPIVAPRPEGGSNLSDLATAAVAREPFNTMNSKTSNSARSIAPLLHPPAPPSSAPPVPPPQNVRGDNLQLERAWSGISAPTKPETTATVSNHVYTLPPLQPSLHASTQAPMGTSVLHTSTASAPPSATTSSYPQGQPLNASANGQNGLTAVASAIANDELKTPQSSTTMSLHGKPPEPSNGGRLQPLSSWAPAATMPSSHSLPPLIGGSKSAPGSAPALTYGATESSLPSSHQLAVPPGMGPPPAIVQHQSSQQPNVLPPLASSGYNHTIHASQSQPVAQPKHHAPATSLSSAGALMANPPPTSRSTARSPSQPTKPAAPLLSDSILSLDLGGDDALAFFEGAGWELFAPKLASKKTGLPDHHPVGANGMSRGWLGGSQGLPSGWLAVIWADVPTS